MVTLPKGSMNSSGKFKIAVINSYYYPEIVGGAEVVVKTLVETYRLLGFKVFVISSGQEDRLDLVNGIRVYRVKNRNLYRGNESGSKSPILKPVWHLLNVKNPFVTWRISEILDYEKPDIVHAHNLNDLSFGVLKKIKLSGLPIVLTLHDYSFMCIKATMFRKLQNCEKICSLCRVYASLKKKYTGSVDFVVGVSKFLLERHLMHGFFTEIPSDVIYNPVTIQYPEKIERNFRNPVFGYIGRLHPSKGIEVLIRVFNRLNLPLRIAGTPFTPEYGDYLRKISTSSEIRFLGWTYAEDFYRSIDVLIIPSLWHDPSPTVVHEANAHGIPVVASNRGGLPELVKNGFTGFIFDPEDEENLIKVLKETREEDWKMFSQNAAGHATLFSPERIAGRYIEIFEKLVTLPSGQTE